MARVGGHGSSFSKESQLWLLALRLSGWFTISQMRPGSSRMTTALVGILLLQPLPHLLMHVIGVIRRLKADKQSSAEHEEFKMSYFWASVKDWKTWTSAIIYMGADGPLYAFSLFLPTIISGLGYTSTTAQLLTVPPYAAACIVTVFIGFLADRTGQRGLCNIGVSLLGVVGFAMLLGSGRPAVQYVGTFLGAMGIYPCIANTISWVSNNTEGVYKRGVTLGFVIGWGNLNGVVSSNIYQARERPRYRTGHAVVMGYLVVCLFGGSVLQYVLLKAENTKRLAGKRDNWNEGKSPEEIELMGDTR